MGILEKYRKRREQEVQDRIDDAAAVIVEYASPARAARILKRTITTTMEEIDEAIKDEYLPKTSAMDIYNDLAEVRAEADKKTLLLGRMENALDKLEEEAQNGKHSETSRP